MPLRWAIERVSRALEVHALKALSFEHVTPPLPELKFVTDQNTVDKEQAFREAYFTAYEALAQSVLDAATEACGDALKARDRAKQPRKRIKPVLKALNKLAKKDPRAAEAAAQLQRAAMTWRRVLVAAETDATKLFDARGKATGRFIKRYDFGPNVATAKRWGTNVIEVELSPTTWSLVKGELENWHYTPLTDEAGEQITLRDKQVEWGEQLKQGHVREAIKLLLDQEFFTVRYAEVKDETPTGEFARVTCAKLLFGTYVFFQYGERIMVFRFES